MLDKIQYETSAGRVFLAILAGAISGGLINTSIMLLFSRGVSSSIEEYFSLFAFITGYALIIIALLGGPVWFLFHKLGWRQWYAAISAGIFIPVIVILVIGSDVPDVSIFALILVSFRKFGMIGAVVAFVVWRVAYRKEHMSEAS